MTNGQPIALVVDDEPLVHMSAADAITSAGLDFMEPAGGEEAVFYLKEYPSLRLLCTDFRIPEVDGLTLDNTSKASGHT